MSTDLAALIPFDQVLCTGTKAVGAVDNILCRAQKKLTSFKDCKVFYLLVCSTSHFARFRRTSPHIPPVH